MDLRVDVYAGGVGAAGVLVAVAAAVGSVEFGQVRWATAGALLVGWVLAVWLPVGWPGQGSGRPYDLGYSVTEVFVAPAVVVLQPGVVVVMAGLAAVVGYVLRALVGDRVIKGVLQARRVAFTVGQAILATAVAAGAAGVVADPGWAVVAAAVGYWLTSGTAILPLQAAVEDRRVRQVAADMIIEGEVRDGAVRLAGTVAGAVGLVVCLRTFGPLWPVAGASAGIVGLWWLSSQLHLARTYTAVLFEVADRTADIEQVDQLQGLVTEVGSRLVNRPVALTGGLDGSDESATTVPVPGWEEDWVLRLGVPEHGNPVVSTHDRLALQALAGQTSGTLTTVMDRLQARREARHDELTGLANRRGFLHDTERLLARAEVDGTPVTVAFLDVDQFKQVNDTLGHQAGDEVLTAVAHQLEAHLRPADIVARLGGDEFVVAFREPIPRTAAAARLRDATIGLPHGVSVSVGTAVFPDDADTAGALIAAADTAMYADKHRNHHHDHT